MSNRYFIVTGTSRGIGQAIAQVLLQNGDTVCGISRNQSEQLLEYRRYTHITYDIQHVHGIHDLIERELGKVDLDKIQMVCLINNAAMLEPLKPIEDCLIDEISANLHISLLAPIELTSSFIQITREWDMRKKIINISSGSAIYANPDMSIYSTAKAGLNMFTRCVGVEQKHAKFPVEIIGVDPGMVETQMQQTARSLPEDQFAMATFFKDTYLNGQLLTAEEIASHLFSIIHTKFESGEIVHYLEK